MILGKIFQIGLNKYGLMKIKYRKQAQNKEVVYTLPKEIKIGSASITELE